MSRAVEEQNRRLLRARDAMDRSYAQPLDVGYASLGTFTRTFRDIVGESPTTYEELQAKGVEFTHEPVERFYGTDCALRDPFGNHIRITQPAANPSPPEQVEFVKS